jgi:hypothetical protein
VCRQAPCGPVPSVTFSLTAGGPLHHLAHALGLTRAPLGGFGPGVVVATFTWGPLIVANLVPMPLLLVTFSVDDLLPRLLGLVFGV